MFNNSPAAQSKSAMVATVCQLGRTPSRARLAARNTLDYTDANGVRRIRLHQTDILTFPKAGGFTVNTGGWNSVTTRSRLNEFLPAGYRVYTHRGVIHLHTPTGAVQFRETVTVGPRGAIRADVTEPANTRLVALIDRYMAKLRGGVPTVEQSGGDPWVFGDPKVDAHIMMDWLRTSYTHRRIVSLALMFSGLTDYGVALHLQDIDRRGGKLDRTTSGRVRRYIRACVGLEA